MGQYLVKVSWLRGLLPVFWWLELDLVLLKGSAISRGVFWCVCELGMALGSVSANGQDCVPSLLMIWYEASCTGNFWPLGGAWS